MAFLPRDLKMLWGNAAGRCSMPDCRKELVAAASKSVPSKNILVGENCHIVGEAAKGPRGKHKMPMADRNRYPNLILLCVDHHTVIDQDPDAWPVNRLQQIKKDHEQWISAQLTAAKAGTTAEAFFSNLVNVVTEQLLLSQWSWVCDNAFRCILVEEFVDGIDNVCEFVHRAVWPKGMPKLRKAIVNLAQRLEAYLKHYMTLARYGEGKPAHYREDKTWKSQWTPKYDQLAERSSHWQAKSVALLRNVVIALNEYAEAVRATLNPAYVLYRGKFTLIDSMGMSTDGFTAAYYMPTQYVEPDEDSG